MKRPWLRHPLTLALALGLLIAALALLGPSLGLASPASRLAAVLLLLLLVAGAALVRLQLSLRPAPAREVERNGIAAQVRGAVRALLNSHLGATRGRGALYELPWLLVLGPPGAGKTSLIRNSGLSFPLAPAGDPDLAPGCRWNFSSQGVLLDVPGRHACPEDEPAEWLEFLRQLRRQRPGGPLDGLLLTLPLPELRGPECAARAGQLRCRISELEAILGRKVPVYLLITKMDLLPGFASFFEDLTAAERSQAWGAALGHPQGPAFDPVRAVAGHFAQLHQGLSEHGARQLAQHPSNQDRPALTTFPLAFRQLGPALATFTEHLAGQDPYHVRPFLRGFYFASTLQEPAAPADLLPGFDLGTASGARAPRPGSHPCFLAQLFSQVIFPDRSLARQLGARRQAAVRLAWLGGGLSFLALLATAWTWSYLGNRRVIAAAQADLDQAGPLLASQRLADRLQGLDLLRSRLEAIGAPRQGGRPRIPGWGLHQGRRLERILRQRYFAGLSELMLAPVREHLERTLAQALRPAPAARPRPPRPKPQPPAAVYRVAHAVTAAGARLPPASGRGPEQLYNALKTYLMLSDRSRMEAAHLSDQLPRCWRPFLEAGRGRGGDRRVLDLAGRAVNFYVSQIGTPDLPVIGNRPELVAEARRVLRGQARRLSPAEQVYQRLKARGNTEFEPMTVARLLQDRDLDLLTGSHAVPGSFTREAYGKFFRTALQNGGQDGPGPDWVLAAPGPGAGPAGLRNDLEALYRADYCREWDAFLQGLTIHGIGDPAGAAAALGRLGDPQESPLKTLLARAAEETSWDNPGALEKSLAGLKQNALGRTSRLLGARPPAAPPGPGPVGSHFSGLAVLAGPGGGTAAPLDGYLQLLQKARTRLGAIAQSGDPYAGARELLQCTLLGAGSELAEAHHYLETTLLARVDGHGREQLRPLLLRPLVQAFAALVPAAQQDINRAWAQEVWGPWSALSGKYPFADSGNEATLADIRTFLRPGEGTLARFMARHLGPLLDRQGQRLAPRHWGGRGVAFREDFLAAVGRLEQAGTGLQEAPPARFELQPVPTPGLREILLEIDGQKLHYRNGPQTWTGFSWPGQASHQGARLQVVAATGAPAQVHSAPGRLGLMRLLEVARVEAPDSAEASLEWPAPAVPGRIRFNYRRVGGADPLALAALRHHTLPPRATH